MLLAKFPLSGHIVYGHSSGHSKNSRWWANIALRHNSQTHTLAMQRAGETRTTHTHKPTEKICSNKFF